MRAMSDEELDVRVQSALAGLLVKISRKSAGNIPADCDPSTRSGKMRLEARIVKLEAHRTTTNPFAGLAPEQAAKIAREFLIGADDDEDPTTVDEAKRILMECGTEQETREPVANA